MRRHVARKGWARMTPSVDCTAASESTMGWRTERHRERGVNAPAQGDVKRAGQVNGQRNAKRRSRKGSLRMRRFFPKPCAPAPKDTPKKRQPPRKTNKRQTTEPSVLGNPKKHDRVTAFSRPAVDVRLVCGYPRHYICYLWPTSRCCVAYCDSES